MKSIAGLNNNQLGQQARVIFVVGKVIMCLWDRWLLNVAGGRFQSRTTWVLNSHEEAKMCAMAIKGECMRKEKIPEHEHFRVKLREDKTYRPYKAGVDKIP